MDQPPTDDTAREALRTLPSVDHLINQPTVASLLADYPRGELLHVVRGLLDERRRAILAGRTPALDVPALALEIRQRLYERAHPNLRRVINATGIVLHTGLGRAPLAEEAIAAIAEVAAGYCNLELNLETGRRGDRHEHVRDLLRELCDVEDALAVNNNAAATYLTLSTLAAGREVVISRGELVEIGGSYRLPAIMAAAQCRMVEVGTTNRTRISDYEQAITDDTAVLLRVHTSNYRIRGFTQSASLAELVELGRRRHLLVVDDLGSGLLTKDLPWPHFPCSAGPQPARLGGCPAGSRDASENVGHGGPTLRPDSPAAWDEPTVAESVAAGADLTLFSGDKLLGGPQAGVILGRAELITRLRKNPLARTFRPGKLTLAGLEATLRLYRDPAAIVQRIPVYRLLARSQTELVEAAGALAEQVAAAAPEVQVSTEPDHSEAGGGSLPTQPFPTQVVVVRLPGTPAEALAEGLRRRELPIICRIRDDALVFDPRTLDGDDADQIPGALAEVIRESQAT
jgi:L-seryl-tRNA(Ser) seleniumtransferase